MVLKHFKIKWPHTTFGLLIFSFELLIILGLPCTLQSTPCEHWTTVKKCFLQQPMKGVETGVCHINNSGTHTFFDSDILIKKQCFLTSQKVCFDLIQSLFNMIYFSKYAQMHVDCLMLKGAQTDDSRIYIYKFMYYIFRFLTLRWNVIVQGTWLVVNISGRRWGIWSGLFVCGQCRQQ